MDANLIKNLKKDLIELRSQIWDKMSDTRVSDILSQI